MRSSLPPDSSPPPELGETQQTGRWAERRAELRDRSPKRQRLDDTPAHVQIPMSQNVHADAGQVAPTFSISSASSRETTPMSVDLPDRQLEETVVETLQHSGPHVLSPPASGTEDITAKSSLSERNLSQDELRTPPPETQHLGPENASSAGKQLKLPVKSRIPTSPAWPEEDLTTSQDGNSASHPGSSVYAAFAQNFAKFRTGSDILSAQRDMQKRLETAKRSKSVTPSKNQPELLPTQADYDIDVLQWFL
jgi:hypothetical protein